MPTYEYECTGCAHHFELRRGFKEMDDAVACPLCGGRAQRIFAPVPIIFKGPGFYVTDQRGPDPSATAEGKPTDSKAGDGKKDTVKASTPEKKVSPALKGSNAKD